MYEKPSDECLRKIQTNSKEVEELLVDWVSEDEVKLIEVKPSEEFKDVSTVLDSPKTLHPKIIRRWKMPSIFNSCRRCFVETRSPIPQNRAAGGNENATFDVTDFDLMFNDPKYYELDTPPSNPITSVSSDFALEDEVKLNEVKPTEEFKDVSTVLDSPKTLQPKITRRWNTPSIFDSCRRCFVKTSSPIPKNRASGSNEIPIFDVTDFDLMFNDPKYYELDTPPLNPLTGVSSDFALTDIPFEALQLHDLSSISSWESLDFQNGPDSDYSSTRFFNTGLNGLRDKPDIFQLFRAKREIFDARMERRESDIWSIPEVRQLLEVLKQTVMWPVAMLLVTYAAPNNWVSCFFCGGFIETHCCLRSYKIVHGISFKC